MTLAANGLNPFTKIYTWTYADATARGAATGFTADDVGSLALQLDDGSLWMLTDDSPITWSNVAGSAGLTDPTTTKGDLLARSSSAVGRLGVGSNGQVLTADSAQTLGVKWAAAASGATIGSGAYSSRPAAGNAGNLYLPTDGQALYRDDGSNWVAFGPIQKLTAPPAAAGWTQVGDTDESLTDQAGALVLTNSGVIANNGAYVRSAPATPYTITACFRAFHWGALGTTNPEVALGLCFRESSSGKLCVAQFSHNLTGSAGSRWSFYVRKWTDPDTFSADYIQATNEIASNGAPRWIRIADNGTNRIVSLSADGVNWFDVHSIGRTDFLTANQVGIAIRAAQSGSKGIMTLLSWEVA